MELGAWSAFEMSSTFVWPESVEVERELKLVAEEGQPGQGDFESSSEPPFDTDEIESPTEPDLADDESLAHPLLAEIGEAEWQCKQAERDVEEAKNELNRRKKILETCVAHLRELCGGASCPQQSESESESEHVSQGKGQGDWRDVPVTVLGLPAGIVQSMVEGGLSTVGKVADYTSAGNELTELKNIGQGKAGKIADALTAFWASRSDISEE